jgi:hypothetical protein
MVANRPEADICTGALSRHISHLQASIERMANRVALLTTSVVFKPPCVVARFEEAPVWPITVAISWLLEKGSAADRDRPADDLAYA